MTSTRELEKFTVNEDSATVGTRWRKWIRAFELFLMTKTDISSVQKQAYLLHLAGSEVQDVYYSLNVKVAAGGDLYAVTKTALEEYFIPQVNIPYERHNFRALSQQGNESIDQYVIRLQQQVENCDFGEKREEMIRDQIIEKCNSNELRRQLLKEGTTLTFQRTTQIARLWEMSHRQAQQMSIEENKTEQVNTGMNQIKGQDLGKRFENRREFRCYRCNRTGHFAYDKNCSARKSTCEKCGKEGHFKSVCRTTMNKSNQKKVRQLEEDDYVVDGDTSEDYYTFNIRGKEKVFGIGEEGVINVILGGIKTNMIIDSGATCNIIDKKHWERLKNSKIQCKSYQSKKRLYAYGSKKPLKILGAFTTKVKLGVGKPEIETEVIVLNVKGGALLGKKTAMELGVLNMGLDEIKTVEQRDFISDYGDVFEGIGKLKKFQLKIPIDKSIIPIAQPVRRQPYNIKEAQRELISKLMKEDIIEKVEGPTPWVSPVHLVPKKDKGWRLCIDMRRANQAVLRERYPIPAIEELLQDLNGSKVFSKLYLKWGYHQVELEEESREITTFITETGLFRYKRLMFGISCAPEMYHRIMTQVLQGCQGVAIFLDDIMVHGKTEGEHDKRLHEVLQRLREKGLTLNKEKCSFRQAEIVFLGHHVSKEGIKPAESNKDTIRQFRQPQSAEEVRSFLGMVNFSGRFIPDLATRSEPLRQLTRKDVTFKWGNREEESFQDLKQSVVQPEVLGFYDKDAETKVIADASPVGLGAVLIQIQKEGPRVIRYASRALSEVERRYSQTEKEALALVWACEKFHLYLYGKDFELFTDHKPLETIFGPKSKPCARIERWVLRPQSYKFRVVYTNGKSNIADPLPRLLDKRQIKQEDEFEEQIRRIIEASVPKSCSIREIEEATENDEELQKVQNCIGTTNWPTEMRKYELINQELSVINGLLLRGTRIIIPGSLQRRMLELAHEGHLGIVGTKKRLRSKVWWRTMDKDVEQWVKTCHGCQITALPDPPEPMTRSELPEKTWEQISIDYLGPLPSGHYLLVIVDYYSRFYEVEITRTMLAEDLMFRLKINFARYGIPEILISDNGGTFRDENFQTFLQEYGVQQRFITPLWPQANGEVERQNRSILKRLRIAQAEGRPWKEELCTYLLGYRETPHSTTGVPPAQLMFGRKIRSKLPEISGVGKQFFDEEVRDQDREKKEEGKIYADARRRAKANTVKPGDLVLVAQPKQNKLTTPFNPIPMKVVEKTGNSVVYETPEGKKYERNTTFLKPFAIREAEEQQENGGGARENTPKSPGTKDPMREQNLENGPRVYGDVRERGRRATTEPAWMKDFVCY